MPKQADGSTPATAALWAFVCGVVVLGALVLALALREIGHVAITPAMCLLACLTIASGRFRIKVPGHSASVSISEVFIFAMVLRYGPAPATLAVAVDGLLISLTQKDRRIYRALFNIAEPAISTSLSAHAFFAIASAGPGAAPVASTLLIAPTVAMAAAYFAVNSTLTAMAVALERGKVIAAVWQRHALYLAMNDYAAASVAVLVFMNDGGINVGVVGLIAPLLALSYAAYKAAANRLEDTDRHLEEVERLYRATVETLAMAVDAKDQVTHGHIRRVQRHTMAVARALGVTDALQLRALEAASLLHDVGKLAVPDYVLNKPGALSAAEFECMKGHAAKGAEILAAVEFPYAVVPVVRHHHEQWSGNGYPDRLTGADIPFGARILTVVDCFDAVTSDRPYRRKMTDDEGVGILLARRGTMYDPAIVDAFIAMLPALRAEDRVIDRPALRSDDLAVVGAAVLPDLTTSIPADDPAASMLIDWLRARLPGAEACLFVPSEAGRLMASCMTPALSRAGCALSVPIGEGLAGWVAVNRHTIVNSHADLDLGAAAGVLGLDACTVTPVFALGDLVGVLAVYLPAPRSFAEHDVRTVGALAQEIALQRARRSFTFLSAVAAA